MPIRVLVVDDHRVLTESLVEVLSTEDDIEVVGTASSAAEARAVARLHAPDIVLMDYQLPDTDGLVATREILLDRPETRVLMLTAIVDPSLVMKALEAGCVGYLTKDMGIDDLAAAIRAAHAGDASLPPGMLGRILPRLRGMSGEPRPHLTTRELQILRSMAEGVSNQVIADQLAIGVHTVRNHVQNIFTKLGAHSRLEAVAIAVRQGLVAFH